MDASSILYFVVSIQLLLLCVHLYIVTEVVSLYACMVIVLVVTVLKYLIYISRDLIGMVSKYYFLYVVTVFVLTLEC